MREPLSLTLAAPEYDGFLDGSRTRLIRPWDGRWNANDVFPGRRVLLSCGSDGQPQAEAVITHAVIHSKAKLEDGKDRADLQAMTIAPGALVIVMTHRGFPGATRANHIGPKTFVKDWRVLRPKIALLRFDHAV
jgi:hypothetical protein